jgi:hypothetical protein
MAADLNDDQKWWAYLERCSVQRGPDAATKRRFFAKLKEFVRPGYAVHQWPEVAPNVHWLLNDRFSEAVGAALEAEMTDGR